MENKCEALLKEYAEVSNNFRMLTDIRFKLLGLTPVATVIAALAAMFNPKVPEVACFVASLFGLVVVLGLVTYSVRNDQLYHELVGRAADIERSLGIRDGSYGFRPRAWLRVGWTMDHGNALALIYGATIAVWLTGAVTPVILMLNQRNSLDLGWLPLASGADKRGAALLMASLLCVFVTTLGTLAVRMFERRKRNVLKRHAVNAMRHALEQRLNAGSAAQDQTFKAHCLAIMGTSRFKKSRQKQEKQFDRRANFLAEPANALHYLPEQSGRVFAAHLVASLCDLPPRWILDAESGRRD